MRCEKTAAVLTDCSFVFDFRRTVVNEVGYLIHIEPGPIVLKYQFSWPMLNRSDKARIGAGRGIASVLEEFQIHRVRIRARFDASASR